MDNTTVLTEAKKEIIGRAKEMKSILAVMNAGKHALLEGPPGTSKSTILRYIGAVTDRPFYIVEGSIDLTPSKLVGHFDPTKVLSDGYNKDNFEKGPLVLAMEQGGILYLEEFNRIPADVSNVLITPMEEREITIPRYGTVMAQPEFAVVASQNPYDDIGTIRVSRAFMDRICCINIGYQTEAEEIEIVKNKLGLNESDLIHVAVRLVRKSRNHPDVKMGASVRAAIDIVALATALNYKDEAWEAVLVDAALMTMRPKIILNELCTRSVEDVLHDMINSLRTEVMDLQRNQISVDSTIESNETGFEKKKFLI